MGQQVGRREGLDLEIAPPSLENFRRRAMIKAAIDFAAATDAACRNIATQLSF